VDSSIAGQEQRATDVPRRRGRYFRHFRDILRNPERRHRALFAGGLASLGIVSTMAYFTYRLQQLPFDVAATLGLQTIRYGPFGDLMRAVSLPGYLPWSMGVVGGGVLLVALRLGWRDGLFLLLVTLLQGLSNHLIKTAIGRPRPADTLVEVLLPQHGNSFPSGHVMFYTVFFGFLFFLAWTRLHRSVWRTLVLVVTGALVLLIGPSRMYVGAHWLSDVIAAHLISLVILLFAIEFYVERFAPPPAGSQRRLMTDG
jgi:undecaprenyl-diphosphatase